MIDIRLRITFITPCFSRGATECPEIRPASIRGMLHHWFRLLGGTFSQEQEVFGGVSGQDKASKVVVRVKEVKGNQKPFSTVPQAKNTQSFNRPAYEGRTSFQLQITERLGGLKDEALFKRAVHAWLLMGTLGYRSTRAAGSFIWEGTEDFPYPNTEQEYEKACEDLAHETSNFKVALVKKEKFTTAEEARKVVSHTLKEGRDFEVTKKLRDLNHPLGCIEGKRKTSPLKFRIAKIQGNFYILAVWDAREKVTGNSEKDLEGIMDLLCKKGRRIGTLLRDSSL